MAEVAQAASTHRQHQVVCRRGCRLSVMFTCHNLLLNPFIDRITVRLRVQASQQCVRDEHTQTRYSRNFVVRDSRWSVHRWLNELNADCAISKRRRTSASSLRSPCSHKSKYCHIFAHCKEGTLFINCIFSAKFLLICV